MILYKKAMKWFFVSLVFSIILTTNIFADNELPSTAAIIETECETCDDNENSKINQTRETAYEDEEDEVNENLDNESDLSEEQTEENIGDYILRITTQKPDDFKDIISVVVTNDTDGSENNLALSPENEYNVQLPYVTTDFSVYPTITRDANRDYLIIDYTVSEPCSKGYIDVSIILDHKIIDVEQEDEYFEEDPKISEYLDTLETVPDDFGLSKNTRPSSPVKAVQEKIIEYESSSIEESEAIEKRSKEEITMVNNFGMIVAIICVMVIAVGLFGIVIYIRKYRDKDEE